MVGIAGRDKCNLIKLGTILQLSQPNILLTKVLAVERAVLLSEAGGMGLSCLNHMKGMSVKISAKQNSL